MVCQNTLQAGAFLLKCHAFNAGEIECANISIYGGFLSFFAAKRGLCGRAAGLWVLLCTIFASFISIPASQAPDQNGLVYCPLQMQWVERAVKPVESSSLEVCGAENYKLAFLEKLALAPIIRRGMRPDVSELFLSFLTKGDRAFDQIPFGPGAPSKPVQLAETAQGGVVSGIHTFDILPQQIFSFGQFCRPPSSTSTADYLSRPLVDLRSAADSVTSRGPPTSI